jgi:transposase-like protein
MKLTESKLKELIVEVIAEEAEKEDQTEEFKDLEPIRTVGDFFRELEKFETVYRSAKTVRGTFDFLLGLIPFYGNATHADDAAGALADTLEAVNNPDGASLYEYEGDFPLLAFLDLDPFIEDIVHPNLISKWMKQLRQQLEALSLSSKSPMPSADELFLVWLKKQEGLEKYAVGIEEAIQDGKIGQASGEYEKKRAEWNKTQKKELMKKIADASDKFSGWKRLLKALPSVNSSKELQKHKASAQRFSSQSPQFFESKK